jgi:hypothetical protein
MPPSDICGQPLSDCITLDRSNDPALKNARKAFPTTKKHGVTLVAGDNLQTCLTANPATARRAMIVGHGAAGTIITGSGALANDNDKKISVDNVCFWVEGLQSRLNGLPAELTLCSCDTGANAEGAQLLMEVANRVNAQVSGFTGLIFIDTTGNITCEVGGVWQHAQPSTPLSSVASPSHEIGESVDLKLKYGKEYKTLNIKDVRAVSFFHPAEKGKPTFSLEGEAAQKLVGTINFAKPSEIGAPLALNTGILEIEYRIQGKPDKRTFVLFNDRLLYDQATPDTSYFASPRFAEALLQHRPESR